MNKKLSKQEQRKRKFTANNFLCLFEDYGSYEDRFLRTGGSVLQKLSQILLDMFKEA
jgi:hypothetical protein